MVKFSSVTSMSLQISLTAVLLLGNNSIVDRFRNPVITLHNCYPFTSLLWISWKSIKLDTAILLKYIVTPNHAIILHHQYEIPIPGLTPLSTQNGVSTNSRDLTYI